MGGKSQDSQAKAVTWRGVEAEKRKMCNKKKKTLNILLCVFQPKQLKEKLRENTSCCNLQLWLRFISIHRIHLKCSAFDCPFSDYISHRVKVSTQKRELFKV